MNKIIKRTYPQNNLSTPHICYIYRHCCDLGYTYS